MLTFQDEEVDHEAYYAEHQAKSNDDCYAFTADWHLIDKFSRSTNRGGAEVYPNSIAAGTHPALVFKPNISATIVKVMAVHLQ